MVDFHTPVLCTFGRCVARFKSGHPSLTGSTVTDDLPGGYVVCHDPGINSQRQRKLIKIYSHDTSKKRYKSRLWSKSGNDLFMQKSWKYTKIKYNRQLRISPWGMTACLVNHVTLSMRKPTGYFRATNVTTF